MTIFFLLQTEPIQIYELWYYGYSLTWWFSHLYCRQSSVTTRIASVSMTSGLDRKKVEYWQGSNMGLGKKISVFISVKTNKKDKGWMNFGHWLHYIFKYFHKTLMIVTTSLSFSFPNVPLCMKLEETGEKGLFFYFIWQCSVCKLKANHTQSKRT